MAKVYQCGNCDNEVKFGAKFCDECGTKLEWPKEKVAKVKVTKTRKKSKKAELDVDPNVVEKLSKDCFWTIIFLYAIGILGINFNTKAEWIIPLILVVSLLNSIFILPLILLRVGIGKWLKSVKDPDNNPEYPTTKLLGKAKGIIVYSAIMGAFFILASIGTLITPEKPKNDFIKTGYTSASQKYADITMSLVELATLGGLAFYAYKVIQSSKTGEKYKYDPNRQQEIESVEIADNSTSEEDDDEDEDYDF